MVRIQRLERNGPAILSWTISIIWIRESMDMVINSVLVSSAESGDVRVLGDLLRVHFPGAVIAEMSDYQALPGEKDPEESTLRLYLEWLPAPQGVSAKLGYRGKEYFLTENLPDLVFQEEPVNQKRRLLRLAVYRLIELASKEIGEITSPSPWGVLTGVRPTKIVHRLFEQGFSEDRVKGHLINDYGISPEKAGLVINVALVQTPYIRGHITTTAHAAAYTAVPAPKTVSIYIGIPFCPTRCHYCSFPAFSLVHYGHLVGEYLHVLSREIASVGLHLKEMGVSVQSIYIGGGTPTSLSAGQLDELLAVVEKSFAFSDNTEITVEGGRPDTLNKEKFMVMKNRGVLRISINPQTMHGPTLTAIGRKHTASEIIDKYRLARQMGFAVINMDLIIGLPGENTEILKQSLKTVIELRPENITLHALAIKRAANYGKSAVVLPDPAEGKHMMSLAHQALQIQGYIPYYLYRQKEILAQSENVGYTLPGYPCIYNIQMMEERQTVIGFGVGAGSKFMCPQEQSLENIYNPKDLGVYFNRIEEIIATKVDKLTAIVYNCL